MCCPAVDVCCGAFANSYCSANSSANSYKDAQAGIDSIAMESDDIEGARKCAG